MQNLKELEDKDEEEFNERFTSMSSSAKIRIMIEDSIFRNNRRSTIKSSIDKQKTTNV